MYASKLCILWHSLIPPLRHVLYQNNILTTTMSKIPLTIKSIDIRNETLLCLVSHFLKYVL